MPFTSKSQPRPPRKRLLRVLFSTALLLVGLVLLDVGFSLFWPLQNEYKSVVETSQGFATCFSSDPNESFPLDIRGSSTHREGLGDVLLRWGVDAITVVKDPVPVMAMKKRTVEGLAEITPHCTLATKKRIAGAAPGRPIEVQILGDSVAYGQGLSDHQTLGFQLARSFPRINFTNYAQAGLNIKEIARELRMLLSKSHGRKLKVMYVYFFNDLLNWRQPAQPQPTLVRQLFSPGSPGEILARRSYLLSALLLSERERARRQVEARHFESSYLGPANRGNLDATMEEIAAMHASVVDRGGQFWVVLYPYLRLPHEDGSTQARIHDMLCADISRRGVHCLDGREAFKEHDSLEHLYVHPTDDHPGPEANRLMASFLAQHIKID